MSWAWTTWLDEAWRAPAFPLWLTLVVAAVAAFVLLATLLRAEASAANGALAVIALLAIGVAAVMALRGVGAERTPAATAAVATPPLVQALPALACLDELAGDPVQAACEGALFGAPDHVAAAVSYVAAQVARLKALDAEAPEAKALRKALQRDRYGLTAHVLAVRDGCTPSSCAAFRLFTDTNRIVANMTARSYDALVGRHLVVWSASAPEAAAAGRVEGEVTPVAGLPPSVPTGRRNTIDYPTSDSIPPVSIMSGEPAAGAAPAPAAPASASAPAPVARAPTPHPRPAPPAKRQSKSPPAAPVQLAPAAPGGDNR